MLIRRSLMTFVLALLVLSGCSDDGPSDSKLGRGVDLLGIGSGAGLPDDVDLDCVGAELNSSDASPEALDAIASGADHDAPPRSYTFAEKDQRELGAALRRAAKAC